MARRHLIGAFCVFSLVIAACGRDSDDSSDTVAATETTAPAAETTAAAVTETTAPAAGGETTVAPVEEPADPCEGAALEATEVGVSESEITVTVMADTGSPLAPGLFQGNVDGDGGVRRVRERQRRHRLPRRSS